MPNLGTVRIVISDPVHAELTRIQRGLQEQKHRQVTFTEVLEVLLKRAGEREEQGA